MFFLANRNYFSQNGYLYQAAFNGTFYEYGFTSIPVIEITDAPEDTDWDRWSILFDGKTYRLYFMPVGKSDRLYQFGFNTSTEKYEYGYNSIPVIPVNGLPEDANVTGFSILHDGANYRLYFKTSSQRKIYQCGYNPSVGENGAYVFGYNSIPEIAIVNAPTDTDWKSWSMLHDGEVYRLYFKSSNDKNLLYQFGFDGKSYTYGHLSAPVLQVIGMPDKTYVKKFNLTHDGMDYRFYNLVKPE